MVCNAGAVEVRNELCRKLGLELPSTAVFDYPTVTALCKFISSLVAQMPGTLLPKTISSRIYLSQQSSHYPLCSQISSAMSYSPAT